MYYKVVYNNGEELVSAVQSHSAACVTYEIDTWVKAPEALDALGYGPLVFKDLDLAKCWRRDRVGSCLMIIFECKVKGIRKLKPLLPFSIMCNYARIQSIAHQLQESYNLIGANNLPRGTVMVGAVKLTKEVS